MEEPGEDIIFWVDSSTLCVGPIARSDDARASLLNGTISLDDGSCDRFNLYFSQLPRSFNHRNAFRRRGTGACIKTWTAAFASTSGKIASNRASGSYRFRQLLGSRRISTERGSFKVMHVAANTILPKLFHDQTSGCVPEVTASTPGGSSLGLSDQ